MQRRAIEVQLPVWTQAEERLLVPDVSDRLGDVTAPALVLVGEHDQPDIHAIAGRLRAALPTAEAATIPAAAHVPSMERPDEFDRLVTAFLDRRI
jgi:pimeloyl-ACP methyl ester carboxylesterase